MNDLRKYLSDLKNLRRIICLFPIPGINPLELDSEIKDLEHVFS